MRSAVLPAVASPFSLMMLDMDNFKGFNDSHGHAAGDALLEKFGVLLLTITRVEDAACRYGGDEFVILLPESSLEVALLRAEEIRQAAAGSTSSTRVRFWIRSP